MLLAAAGNPRLCKWARHFGQWAVVSKNYDDFCYPSRVYSLVWQRCWQAIWTDPPGQYRSSFMTVVMLGPTWALTLGQFGLGLEVLTSASDVSGSIGYGTLSHCRHCWQIGHGIMDTFTVGKSLIDLSTQFQSGSGTDTNLSLQFH